ncbi:hypothetical protein OKW76_05305 [Sphingomonas sp. S1-29]|uniref:hypothetical protein n=1 Tax=Sphingomonas sp. S1-29 TaxID=2991074 RepID=UPI002240C028|nr:hypothetical protein [Sphingomonas sp. S1-29]UZK70462.1 hypothetical protein OKW76_05305 [Sphingomonas sp. S1-29]
MITLKRFRRIEAAVRAAGYGDSIEWSERIQPPVDAEAFAEATIYVICNSGMKARVALGIYNKCIEALRSGGSATDVFGHPGKAVAIDLIWHAREPLMARFAASNDKLSFCSALPWIGSVTQYHLAKNLGVDTAKPDVHVARLAKAEGSTTHALCERLARGTGLRAATVDTILWRACELGVIDSREYLRNGWKSAFSPYVDD